MKGDYAHLYQQSDKDLEDAVDATNAIVFYDDTLHLETPYIFFCKSYLIHLIVQLNKLSHLLLYYLYICIK